MAELFPVLPFIFLAAILYTSVGHGGATAYLAVFSLFHIATAPLVTVILVMNITAAGIAWVMYRQAGYLRLSLLLPFVVTSVPMAYLGGSVPLTGRAQSTILGLALLGAGLRLLLVARPPTLIQLPTRGPVFYAIAAIVGAALGFLAGATGIGGGIFLSPIVIVLGWGTVRDAASVASAFIVLNSLAGLVARLPSTPIDVTILAPLLVVTTIGAFIGSFLGARRFQLRWLQVALALVLLVSAAKNFSS